MVARFKAQPTADGWLVADRMTGRTVANAACSPFSQLAQSEAAEIAEMLSLADKGGGLRFAFVGDLICIASDHQANESWLD